MSWAGVCVIVHYLFKYKAKKFRMAKGEQFLPSGVVKPWDSSPANRGVKRVYIGSSGDWTSLQKGNPSWLIKHKNTRKFLSLKLLEFGRMLLETSIIGLPCSYILH